MTQEELRSRIEEIDGELGELFARRMELSAKLAREKAASGRPLPDIALEREARTRFRDRVGDRLGGYAGVLYSTLLDVTHSYQDASLGRENLHSERIAQALEATPRLFPERAAVACQGVEGAYSQQAAQRLFREPDIVHVRRFEDVFDAIESGRCRYGVLPVENSSAGSVNRIYDLMTERRCSIVRSVRIKIDHDLLALPGASVESIRQIYSHEQAISQCAAFLQAHPGIKVTACENTAAAAKLAAESGRTDIAALASHSCGALYGLATLAASVQDNGNNHTRFICISRELEIYPGADRTSVMLTLPHRPGALYLVMARIAALGINLTKLESRPLPDRDFEFMFYFDLDAPVYSPQLIRLIGDLEAMSDSFRYLGSYSEAV